MENVINAEFTVLGAELNDFVNQSNASDADKSKFKQEFDKAHAFYKSCVEELKVRAKNGKDYVKELSVAFWNKIKDLANKVFGSCKELYEKVKAYVLGLLGKE